MRGEEGVGKGSPGLGDCGAALVPVGAVGAGGRSEVPFAQTSWERCRGWLGRSTGRSGEGQEVVALPQTRDKGGPG